MKFKQNLKEIEMENREFEFVNEGMKCPVCGSPRLNYKKWATGSSVEFDVYCHYCGEILFSTVELKDVRRD